MEEQHLQEPRWGGAVRVCVCECVFMGVCGGPMSSGLSRPRPWGGSPAVTSPGAPGGGVAGDWTAGGAWPALCGTRWAGETLSSARSLPLRREPLWVHGRSPRSEGWLGGAAAEPTLRKDHSPCRAGAVWGVSGTLSEDEDSLTGSGVGDGQAGAGRARGLGAKGGAA